MRRVGLVLLAIGLAGFLFASAQKSRYETVVAGAAGETATSPAAEKAPSLGDRPLVARGRWRDRRGLYGFAGEEGLAAVFGFGVGRGFPAADFAAAPSFWTRSWSSRKTVYIRSNAFCFSPCVSAVTSR